jgi:hypothetical protein
MRYVGTITAAVDGELRSPLYAAGVLWDLIRLTDTVLDLTDEKGQRYLVNLATGVTYPIVADRKRDTIRRLAWASIGRDWDVLLTGLGQDQRYLLGLGDDDVRKLLRGHGALAELLKAEGVRVEGVHRRSGDTRFVRVPAWRELYDPPTSTTT